jgi:PSP1-like protein
MEEGSGYLVRYGLMGHVGRFLLDSGMDRTLEMERGQAVVIQTDRGLELGEVLVPLGPSSSARHNGGRLQEGGVVGSSARAPGSDLDRPKLLRPAGPTDLENARRSEVLRAERFAFCRRILGEGGWPMELIDVEPLLDQNTMVLHVLGPRDLDLALLRAEFRSLSDFDVLFEPAGSGPGSEIESSPGRSAPPHGRIGGCGDCDCSVGGCGAPPENVSASAQAAVSRTGESSSGSCEASSHSGCASCGVTKWLAGKRHAGK